MQIRDLIPWVRKDLESWHKSGDGYPIVTLQRDMNRIFDTFWQSFDHHFETPSFPWESGMPRCDVVETDKTIEVFVELPGLEEKDIDISLTDDALTIRGERKTKQEEDKKGYFLAECHSGFFSRTISLPSGVDREKVAAAVKNGLLTVTLPKIVDVQTRVKKIPVNTR